jgi:hypothetical protein
MEEYPKSLLPCRSYPALSEEAILPYCLVRETQDNLYTLLEQMKQGYAGDDIIRKIIDPQPSLREVFELSLFLYGYYTECHVGIKVSDASLYDAWNNDVSIPTCIRYSKKTAFPLYLKAEVLYNQTICFNDEEFLLSFSHKPTCVNYWHFQLWTKDTQTQKYIPREATSKRLKHLAKHILEQYVVKAICLKSEVKEFQFPF